jgi:hypothetical protein
MSEYIENKEEVIDWAMSLANQFLTSIDELNRAYLAMDYLEELPITDEVEAKMKAIKELITNFEEGMNEEEDDEEPTYLERDEYIHRRPLGLVDVILKPITNEEEYEGIVSWTIYFIYVREWAFLNSDDYLEAIKYIPILDKLQDEYNEMLDKREIRLMGLDKLSNDKDKAELEAHIKFLKSLPVSKEIESTINTLTLLTNE